MIDWFTVGAQLLNFAILVWLLKRFLYKPVLDAIDEREMHVANAVSQAERMKIEAQVEREQFQLKNEQLDRDRTTLMKQATEQAQAHRQGLIDEAQQAASKIRKERQAALQAEAKRLSDCLVERTQGEVLTIARQVFRDLAAADFDARASEVFVERLAGMPVEAKETLRGALLKQSEPVLVRSTFELPEAQRNAIEAAVRQMLSKGVVVRFEAAPQLLGGIELSAGGQKVAWSIAEYLASLQGSIDDLIESHTASTRQSE